jgi:hypothetical protein
MSAPRTQPMTETPSPLPWEVVAATDHHGAYIVAASGLDVCDLYAMSNPLHAAICNGGDSRPVPFMDMDANARLIVEAVNSHEALKARIQELEAALQVAQELFAIVVNPQDHPDTSIKHLGAQCKEIECNIRGLLQPKDGAK